MRASSCFVVHFAINMRTPLRLVRTDLPVLPVSMLAQVPTWTRGTSFGSTADEQVNAITSNTAGKVRPPGTR